MRGRAGRQGDPGSSQFFVSTEDDLARVFGGDRLKSIMDRLGVSEDDVIENRFVSNAIQQAQAKIEGHNFDMRKHVLEYDDVMNKHRTAIYKIRKDSLFAESSKELIQEYLFGQVEMLAAFHFKSEGEPDIKEITESIKAIIGPDDDLQSRLSEIGKNGQVAVIGYLLEYTKDRYKKHELEVGSENMRKLEQYVLLRTVDELWMDHIDTMEYLRDSVNLRAYGQRDPLVEYKIEAQKLFQQLAESIKVQVANVIFKVGFVQQPREVKVQEGRLDLEKGKSAMERESSSANSPPNSEQREIGRNDPCYCGSGKKFKKCHGK